MISLRTIRAIVRSRSLTRSGRSATHSSASVIVRTEISQMLRPSTVTPIASGRRRLPSHTGHGRSTMYFSSSVLMYSDSVSRKRRSRFVIRPSNVAQ